MSTIIISTILLAVMSGIAASMVNDKIKGKATCGCGGCSGCCGSCNGNCGKHEKSSAQNQ